VFSTKIDNIGSGWILEGNFQEREARIGEENEVPKKQKKEQ
jgi:hypothetical protein